MRDFELWHQICFNSYTVPTTCTISPILTNFFVRTSQNTSKIKVNLCSSRFWCFYYFDSKAIYHLFHDLLFSNYKDVCRWAIPQSLKSPQVMWETRAWCYLFKFKNTKHALVKEGLTLSQTSPGFYVSAVQAFWKHYGKRRNCLQEQFLLFPQCFLSF